MTGLDGCDRTDRLATTKTGLKGRCELDTRIDATGIKGSDGEMASLEWIGRRFMT